ncbi:MAG: hypothetical protein K940chlam7_00421 [Chlamydiae bacterium]|nr:hypothetical protein [Chlamydiota bacterium]
MLFSEIVYSSPNEWRRLLEKGTIPPLEDSRRLPPYCLKLEKGQLSLEEVDYISRRVFRKDPGPATLSQIDAFCSQLGARDIKVQKYLSELSREGEENFKTLDTARKILNFASRSMEKDRHADRENSKEEHDDAIQDYRSCFNKITAQTKQLESSLRDERCRLRIFKQELERTVDFAWDHRIPTVIRKFESSRYPIIRTLCHIAKRVYRFVVILLFTKKYVEHRSNKIVMHKSSVLSLRISQKKIQIRSLKQQYKNSQVLSDAVEVAMYHFEKGKSTSKYSPKNISAVVQQVGEKIRRIHEENSRNQAELRKVTGSMKKLSVLKELAKERLQTKEKEVITYLEQMHLPGRILDEKKIEMIRIDPYLRKRPPVLEAYARALIRLWEGLTRENSREACKTFINSLHAVRELHDQKELDKKSASLIAMIRIQILERSLRMVISVKTPLKLPTKHQLERVHLNWNMPSPQASSIPEAPEHVNLLEIKTLYESIENKIPLFIDDDTDDDGKVIRKIPKEVFKKQIFSIVDSLAGEFLIKDSYYRPMPAELQVKVCNLLKHFVLWVENEKEKIRKKVDPIQEKKLQEELDTVLIQIFTWQLGLAFFHCNDRIATELTQIYEERIIGMYQNQNPYEQIRTRVLMERRQFLKQTIIASLDPSCDMASSLRYFTSIFEPLLGLTHDSLSLAAGNSFYDRYVDIMAIMKITEKVEKYIKKYPMELIREITTTINDPDKKDPLFAYGVLAPLFEERYEGKCVESQLVDGETSHWKKEATAQLLFDAGVLHPFTDEQVSVLGPLKNFHVIVGVLITKWARLFFEG